MPERDPRSTYDSTVAAEKPPKPITRAMEEAHEAAMKTEVKMADLVSELKKLAPAKADMLDAWLAKCEAGKLPIAAVYMLMKSNVGLQKIQEAYTSLAPGFNPDTVFPFEKPITVM